MCGRPTIQKAVKPAGDASGLLVLRPGQDRARGPQVEACEVGGGQGAQGGVRAGRHIVRSEEEPAACEARIKADPAVDGVHGFERGDAGDP